MRVILSRKGFDSSNGGFPSPILPNDTMVSLPIPSSPAYDDCRYSQLILANGNLGSTGSYLDVMRDLAPNRKITAGDESLDLTEKTICHLDPDIRADVLKKRERDWRGCFGQIDAAQSHLFNEGTTKEEDPPPLFLFFGWFRRTEWNDGKLGFVKTEPDQHVIYGYLQVDQVITDFKNLDLIPKWIHYHPHMREERACCSTNAIYVARKNITWNEGISGWGVFKFRKELVLTKKGLSRSRWELPDFFRRLRISYHSQGSWKKLGYFQSAARGQEFVIQGNHELENWAKRLVENGQIH